jgi:hypothetical protein
MRRWICLLILMATTAWATPPFDHTLFSNLLKEYVRDGRVDYPALRARGKGQLNTYLKSLATAQPESMPHSERVAFWLNAYNALVIHLIVEGNSPSSVLSRGGFFRRSRFEVAGENLTLDDIEHSALRPLAKDPRVHFVLVCGAKSCPPLRADAFLGSAQLEQDLEQATTRFLNDPKQVQIDWQQRRLRVSKLFDWYAEDFGEVIPFIAKYRTAEERAQLLEGKWKVDFFDYDWSINATPD